jgi:hypothetical protein
MLAASKIIPTEPLRVFLGAAIDAIAPFLQNVRSLPIPNYLSWEEMLARRLLDQSRLTELFR